MNWDAPLDVALGAIVVLSNGGLCLASIAVAGLLLALSVILSRTTALTVAVPPRVRFTHTVPFPYQLNEGCFQKEIPLFEGAFSCAGCCDLESLRSEQAAMMDHLASGPTETLF